MGVPVVSRHLSYGETEHDTENEPETENREKRESE